MPRCARNDKSNFEKALPVRGKLWASLMHGHGKAGEPALPGPVSEGLPWGRLIGGLGREFVLRHGRDHGLRRFFVPAEDEAGHDDPEGEQSDEGGTGGDGNHFNLSPNWFGAKTALSAWKAVSQQIVTRILRQCYACVTGFIVIPAKAGIQKVFIHGSPGFLRKQELRMAWRGRV